MIKTVVARLFTHNNGTTVTLLIGHSLNGILSVTDRILQFVSILTI